MSKIYPYIGIDGCKSGWVWVAINRPGNFQFGVIERFSQVDGFLAEAQLILVDIPIGLPSRKQPDRLCDNEARTMIGARRSSVFPAPARSALMKKTHKEGSEENYRAVGRLLSKQSWAIGPKIREVDEYLRTKKPGNKIREMHPEVAFCALNDGRTLQFPKKDACGAIERFNIIREHWQATQEDLFEIRKSLTGNGVASDDILDAMVGAVTARYSKQLATLPVSPVVDDEGLPMEMVYWASQ